MHNRHNPLFWSFGAGTWAGVHLRISWLMPLVVGAFLYHFGLQMGGALFGVLFFSVLLHEIGHILAARATEGSGDEILMWPFGGLAFVETTSIRSQILTAAAGPLVNGLLCLLFVPAVLASHLGAHVLNPLLVPIAPETFLANVASNVQVLTFWMNWTLLLVNLIPAFPLDGGQIFRSILTSRMGPGMGTEVAIRVAWVFAFVMLVVGALFFAHVLLVCIAFLIILLAVQEHFQLQSTESYDDSFMGYDFSQGYTSLERSDQQQTKPERRAGLLQRWLAKRRADKLRRMGEQQQLSEQQLDAILAKVHAQGMASLSQSEKRLLKRASNRYKSRGDSQ